MSGEAMWIDSTRFFDAIPRLRQAVTPGGFSALPIGDVASDDLLFVLGALVELSHDGVRATVTALADDATMNALDVLAADDG